MFLRMRFEPQGNNRGDVDTERSRKSSGVEGNTQRLPWPSPYGPLQP